MICYLRAMLHSVFGREDNGQHTKVAQPVLPAWSDPDEMEVDTGIEEALAVLRLSPPSGRPCVGSSAGGVSSGTTSSGGRVLVVPRPLR